MFRVPSPNRGPGISSHGLKYITRRLSVCYQRMACVSPALSSRTSHAAPATKCLGGTRRAATCIARDLVNQTRNSSLRVCQAQNDGGYVRFCFDCVRSRSWTQAGSRRKHRGRAPMRCTTMPSLGCMQYCCFMAVEEFGCAMDRAASSEFITLLPSITVMSARTRCRPRDQKYLSLRAEVENPFRTFRVVILGFFLVSAGVATLIATTQLIGSIGNAPAAMPLQDTVQTWLIDVGALTCLLYGYIVLCQCMYAGCCVFPRWACQCLFLHLVSSSQSHTID